MSIRTLIDSPRKAGSLWFYLGLVPMVCVILDQLAKWEILKFFHERYETSMLHCAVPKARHVNYDLSWLMDFTLSCNYGISWGLMPGQSDLKRWGLAAFAIIVSLGLVWLLVKTKDRLTSLSFALILGGSVGNVIDRIRYGAVVDFLDFSSLNFNFIFNPADVFITMGVIGMLISVFFGAEAREAKAAKEAKKAAKK